MTFKRNFGKLAVCIISIICILAVEFSSLAVNAAEQTVTGEMQNEADLECIGLLSALNVIKPYDDGTYGLDASVSRAELAVLTVRMLGMSENELTENTYFSDLPNNHWAASSVEKLINLAIVSPSGEYRPDDNVALNEVCKILVSAAGYRQEAEARGGYPGGYIETAKKMKLFNGISDSDLAAVNKKCVYTMMFNAMKADFPDVASIGEDSIKYEKNGDNMLSVYFDVYDIEDRVNGVWGISLDAKSALDKGDIRIGDTLISTGDVRNTDEYLGHNVICYYKDNGSNSKDKYSLVYIQNDDESIKIFSDDFIGFDNYNIKYRDDKGNNKSVSVSPTVTVVRNGDVISQNISSAFDIDYGTVEVIKDSNVVIIKEIENLLCGSVNENESKIYIRNNKSEPIDYGDGDLNAFKLHQGSGIEVEPSALKYGVLLSVMRSEDYIDITVSTQSKTVTVDGMRTGQKYVIVESGEDSYEILPEVYEENKKILKLGASVSIQVDSMGKVADVQLTEKADNRTWGYIFASELTNELSQKLAFKMYTSSGELRECYLSGYVTFDGDKLNMKSKDDMDTAYSLLKKPQLVIYTEKSDGTLISLDTANQGASEGDNTLVRSLDWGEHSFTPWVFFKPMNFVNKSETMVLSVPDEGDLKSAEAEDFGIATIGKAITYQWARNYECELYRFDKSKFMEDVVVMRSSSNVKQRMTDSGNRIFVVDRITKQTNKDGKVVDTMRAIDRTGKVISYTMYKGAPMCDNRTETGNLKPDKGDCIIATFQTDSKLKEFQIVYDSSEDKWLGTLDGKTVKGGDNDDVRISMAYYSKTVGEFGAWSYDIGGEINEAGKLSDMAVTVVERNGDRCNVYKGSPSSLVSYEDAGGDCSKIIVQSRKGEPHTIVIYK